MMRLAKLSRPSGTCQGFTHFHWEVRYISGVAAPGSGIFSPTYFLFMKSFLGFLLALLVTGSLAAPAQTAPATTMSSSSSSTKMSTTKTTTPSSTTTTTKMKADGTPDMRYKANKTTKMATGPTKADGTPDMRYKTNKTTTKTKM